MRDDLIKNCVSQSSLAYHLLAYLIKKPKMRLENGMFIISIDVDAGSRELGLMNKGKNDENVARHASEYRIGEIEEAAFPLFLEVFDRFEVPVTFAIRGQLTEVRHSILGLLVNSPVKHDVGAHGYYHRKFTDINRNEAERELQMISAGMKKFGINPQSFVFPRNSVAHLDLLESYGYKCYRSYGDFIEDCMCIEKRGQLYDVHPSLYFDYGTRFGFLKKILDISTKRGLPFHGWFHLWNFGETVEEMRSFIDNVLAPFLHYAERKQREGVLSFETMLSATLEVENRMESR